MQENLNRFLIELSDLINVYFANPKPNLKKNNFKGVSFKKLQKLQKEGVCTFTLNQNSIDQLNFDLKGNFKEIENFIHKKKYGDIFKIKFNDFNRVLDKKKNVQVFKIVENFLFESKAYEVIAEFLKCEVYIKAIAAQYNDKEITKYFYNELDKQHLPINNKFDYMHIDSKIWPRLKILIYLNEVDDENGPFRYSIKTSKIMSLSEKLIRKTNDRIKLNDENYRSLPYEYKKHAFLSRKPEDIASNRDILNLAFKNEIKLLSKNGKDNVILFDVDGIHRGGFVSKKSRKILQVLFEKKNKL